MTMKNRYTEIVHSEVITGEFYIKQRRIHKRLEAENERIMAEVRSWRKREFVLDSPPLLVRLKADAEGIPAGTTILTSYEIATALIRRRAAVPVGDFKAVPDLVIEDEELCLRSTPHPQGAA